MRAYLLRGLRTSEIVHSVYGFGMVNGGHYVREAILHFTQALLLPAGTGLDTRSGLLPADTASGINFSRIPGFLRRSDNMVKLRGVNVYPTAIGALLEELDGLTGEYVCRVAQHGTRNIMTVVVEAAAGTAQDTTLQESVAAHLRRRLGVEVGIELVGPEETAPLTEINRRQKPIRLIDERTP